MAQPHRKAVIVGISGASSSGKTTLARLLRDIFPNSFVLHEDDFYKPEEKLPVKDGFVDWDCAEALEIPDMEATLTHIEEHGTLPPTHDSKEDRNPVSACPVPPTTISSLKTLVSSWTAPGQPGHMLVAPTPLRLCLLDGFLLFAPPVRALQRHLAVKLFLRVPFDVARVRRAARSGYVTIEGWWVDPPGYVEKVVWPNYVRNHAWMFEGGDVEGRFNERAVREEGILTPEGGWDGDMGETLRWAVQTVIAELERIAGKGN